MPVGRTRRGRFIPFSSPSPSREDGLLLEDGSGVLLLEDGSYLLLE